MSVKITHWALDEEGEDVIVRGRIDPSSLDELLVDDYQREILPLAKIQELMRAFEEGGVPDVDLGMRGHKTIDRDDAIFLHDPVFIIDGLQRITAAKEFLRRTGGRKPRIGAAIHLGTNRDWERERFKILNADRTKLSANVLARNLKDEIDVMGVIYGLCREKGFCMEGRVCWSQRAGRDHLVSSITLLKTIGTLHSHYGPGKSVRLHDLARGLQTIFEKIGTTAFTANVKTFFDLIDECWKIRQIAFKEGACWMRSSFLVCLAKVLSNHQDFWRGRRLFIPAELRQKIRLFPVSDPTVIQLASTSGKAREMLYQMMVDHVNSGKRTRRLKSRLHAADEVPEAPPVSSV